MKVTGLWDKYLQPIPVLQWLIIIVLSTHIIISQPELGSRHTLLYILGLLAGNMALLYGLPKLVGFNKVVISLVVIDTLLVPTVLYMTGTTSTDLFVVYFGIIMIAGASGNLKQALAMAAATWVAYGIFMQFNDQDGASLSVILLRLPFFLAMTLFYGVVGELTHRERKDKEQLAYAATHDELTGICNRRSFTEALTRELEEAKRFATPLCCAVIDVDEFKQINDTYGHDAGDVVLRGLSGILTGQCRVYDVVGRMGGDEFVWLLPRVEAENAIIAGERLREAVQNHKFQAGRAMFRVTTSIGMATYMPGDGAAPTLAQMMKAADTALYQAKQGGRNKVCTLPSSAVSTIESAISATAH